MKLRIKELRKARDWTVDHLAGVTGLSKGFLSQLENERRQPSTDTIKILADAFCVSAIDLIDDGDDKDDLSRMIEIMRMLSPEDRKAAIRVAAGFLAQGTQEQT